MSHEHSHIQRLKHRWGQEDAERDELEEQARRKFLEQEANQIFSPIENYLTKLAEVLRTAGASVEVDARWEHLGDQKLRRIAKVSSSEPAQQLPLDFTIQGASIFYGDKLPFSPRDRRVDARYHLRCRAVFHFAAKSGGTIG